MLRVRRLHVAHQRCRSALLDQTPASGASVGLRAQAPCDDRPRQSINGAGDARAGGSLRVRAPLRFPPRCNFGPGTRWLPNGRGFHRTARVRVHAASVQRRRRPGAFLLDVREDTLRHWSSAKGHWFQTWWMALSSTPGSLQKNFSKACSNDATSNRGVPYITEVNVCLTFLTGY